MATNDHYVPQTYLELFADSSIGGKLHAYSKSTGKSFQPSPKNVCVERDGDLNEEYLADPKLRADFRAIHEGHLAASIAAFEACRPTVTDKYIVAMFMAAVMTCTPAWRRVGAAMLNNLWKGRLLIEKEMRTKNGVIDEFPLQGIEMLERGEIQIDTDPKYVDARSTRDVMSTALAVFQEDWIIAQNNTAIPFITSDNPSAIEWVGTAPQGIMYRHLPISPRMSITMTHSGKFSPQPVGPEETQRILTTPREHGLRYAHATPAFVTRLNRLIVQCAEDHVFSSCASDEVAQLTRKYARHQLTVEYVQYPDGPNSFIQGIIFKVKESL